MRSRSTSPRPPGGPPATPNEGAAFVRDYVVKLYDKQDGQGVEWRVIAETLFKAAFDVLDRLPDETCKSVAARVHEGAYDRTANGPKANPDAASVTAETMPFHTSALQAPRPKGPRS